MHMESISSLLLTIRQKYETLTESERRIAEYVLNHSDQIAMMRIHDLSVATGAANSAIVRFCKALGFSGFSEFKFSLSSETNAGAESYMLPTIKRGDGVTEIFNKIFTSNIHSLYATIQQLDMERAANAVELMHAAKHILLLGTGTSEPAVLGAMYQLMQFGFSTLSATNAVTMRTAAINMQQGDVAIGISYCGHTHDTVESLHLAHQCGASTIAITSYQDSPLCKDADIILYAPPEDIPYMSDGAITSTRNSLVCILDSLIITLACKNYDHSMAKIYARNTCIFPSVRE